MYKKHLHKKNAAVVIGLLTLFYLIAMGYWLFNNPVKDLPLYVPGMDDPEAMNNENEKEEINIGAHFERLSAEEENPGTSIWPNFRGNNHDNIIQTDFSVNFNWDQKEPAIVWTVELGEGHAAPAIYKGNVYILDYNEEIRADILRCFSLRTGKEIWRRWYNIHIRRNHGMSRTIPAVSENYIVTIGPRGQVMCVHRPSGDFLWSIDMVAEYDTEIPFWYTGQCPFIDDGIAVLAPAGESLLIGVDCRTGDVVWETPNPNNVSMSHASIMPMDILGKRMYVYAALGGTYGVSAEKEDAGTLLWEYTEWSPTVVAPSPLQITANDILLTAGYGAGSAVITMTEKEGNYEASTRQRFTPRDGIASEQQTPLLYDGRVYAILPNDAGANRNQFTCYHPDDLSTPLWSSGREERFKLGPYLVLNDKFLLLNDDGTLFLAETSPDEWSLLHKIQLFEGQDAWGPMAFADGYLLVRDDKNLYCIDLR